MAILAGCVMVAPQLLELLVGVRIPARQPNSAKPNLVLKNIMKCEKASIS